MKKCTKCKEIKRFPDFYNNNKLPFGKDCICKSCYTKYRDKYKVSKRGVVAIIYGNQRDSSKKRNHPMPDYTFLELKDWVFSQSNFNMLYNNWVKSGYKKELKPSCDRLDNNKPYTFDNLQLITWNENKYLYYRHLELGLCKRKLKPVLQYNIKGSFIEEFYSIAQASRINNIPHSNIIKVCKGERSTAGGYIWKYK